MLKNIFSIHLLKPIAIIILSAFYLNTICAQKVALSIQKKLVWIDNSENQTPLLSNFNLGKSKFGANYHPSITFTVKTANKSLVEFSNFDYQELIGFNEYKQNNLMNLSSQFATSVFYTLEGNAGYTGINLCPFKSEGGRIYKLTSFDYTLNDGENFVFLQNKTTKRAASNSILASGQWIKFSVTQDGLYKINSEWLDKAGINLNGIDPRTVKIYSTQGGMVSEVNADFRYDDLPENAIQIIGENDGKFDANDYILFYAQSPNKWKFNTVKKRYEHIMNFYSDKTYFFLTFGGSNGKRMNPKGDGSNLSADKIFDTFNHHIFHDEEKENICHEGRIVLGEKFDVTNVYSFNHTFNDIDGSQPTSIYFYAVAASPSTSKVTMTMNNSFASALNFSAIQSSEPPCFIEDINKIGTFTFNSSNPTINLNFTYNKPNSSSKAWLDYYEIHCVRKLNFNENFMPFRVISSSTANVAEYQLSNLPNDATIYDVTDPINVQVQSTYIDNSNSVFRDITSGAIHEFVLNSGSFFTPVFEGSIANQNLHATGIVQFIIVSPPVFLDAANKLADFHRTRDNMSVLVTTPQMIYNEFSGGAQDISAIRDFFKLVYYNNTNPVNQLKYAMLMGDASYDYKDKLVNNTNFVATYESDPYLYVGNDYYCSDDFFGFLDPGDGIWNNEQKLEIAVTRLPVATNDEALGMVNKIVQYKENISLGDWRNAVTFLADDVDEPAWEFIFVKDFEEISDSIDKNLKNLNVRKVYLDAYKQENLGGSQRYPDVQAAIKKEFEQGTLIFNYMGHGGDEYIASEKVIDIPLINSMQNIHNLPAFFTASCSIGKYDDATHKSGGEYFMTNSVGGAIAMFTTVRIVYVGPNAEITKYFWNDCAFVKIGGEWPTLGEIYKKLKNRPNQDQNDRKFTLFADPALKLNYPEHIIKVDSINNHSTQNGNDTLKALAKVTFKGHVEDISGNPMTNFNGFLSPTIYDKKSNFLTMGNNSDNLKMPYDLYSNIIYRGESSINNGKYSFSFVVPKDIAYNYGYGKVSLYGKNNNTDASGNAPNLIVGGTSSNIASDNTGPEIELFVDDFTFVSGGLTDNTPLLLAKISDENGINTSGSGVGRDLLITIDKGTINEKSYVVNNFYKSNLNSYTTGEIKYQLENLSDGKHTYTLKVWDVYNNSSVGTLEFIISNSDNFQIKNLLNYPNPFTTNTIFHFDQNRAGQNLSVIITVFTLSGKVIKTIEQFIPAANGHVSDITWNGRDDYDDKLSSGVYIYRINVKTDDGQSFEKIEKLVILN